ncbi:hypothetical protein GW17_00004955, partial [Ensete ventricosum]
TMQQRQTSILAFLRKPSAENRRCDGPSPFSDVLPGRHFGSTGAEKPSDEPFPEIRGTDTPPEKPCCQVFTAVAPEIKGGDSRGANTFSSIMRKFVKEDKSEGFRKGYEFDLFVGISEAGIDDAVLKLTARGYKVGRMEQLETSEQAKARGATSVIQRTLVSVSTPCTPIDGSIGLEAVHLLALKEFDDTLRNGELLPYHVYRNCLRMDGQTLLNLEIFSNNIDGSLSGT